VIRSRRACGKSLQAYFQTFATTAHDPSPSDSPDHDNHSPLHSPPAPRNSRRPKPSPHGFANASAPGKKANSNARTTPTDPHHIPITPSGRTTSQSFLLRLKSSSLYGIPISLKDCFDRAGTATRCAPYYDTPSHRRKNAWVAQRRSVRARSSPEKLTFIHSPMALTGAERRPDLRPASRHQPCSPSAPPAARCSVRRVRPSSHRHRPVGFRPRPPLHSADAPATALSRCQSAVKNAGRRSHLRTILRALGLLFRDLAHGPALASAHLRHSPDARTNLNSLGYV